MFTRGSWGQQGLLQGRGGQEGGIGEESMPASSSFYVWEAGAAILGDRWSENGGAGVGSRTGCSYYRFWDIGPGVQQVPQPVGSVSQLPRLTAALF